MTLDLTQFTSQLEAQLADLSKQRTEFQKELECPYSEQIEKWTMDGFSWGIKERRTMMIGGGES